MYAAQNFSPYTGDWLERFSRFHARYNNQATPEWKVQSGANNVDKRRTRKGVYSVWIHTIMFVSETLAGGRATVLREGGILYREDYDDCSIII